MLEYKVVSYRGDATLEKWLSEMAKQWYSADRIVADNWKCVVVYSRWALTKIGEDVVDTQKEATEDTVDTQTESSEDIEEE